VATGRRSRQRHVVTPRRRVVETCSPLPITTLPSGTIASSSSVALSPGVLLLGNQVCAPVGSPTTWAPSPVAIQPSRDPSASTIGRGIPR
jgi:hypothetical protein